MSILYDAFPPDDPTLASSPPPMCTFPPHHTAVWYVIPTGHLMFTGPLNKSGVGNWANCSLTTSKLAVTMVTRPNGYMLFTQ